MHRYTYLTENVFGRCISQISLRRFLGLRGYTNLSDDPQPPNSRHIMLGSSEVQVS